MATNDFKDANQRRASLRNTWHKVAIQFEASFRQKPDLAAEADWKEGVPYNVIELLKHAFDGHVPTTKGPLEDHGTVTSETEYRVSIDT